MKKIATIDCETDPFLFGRIPVPFIWGFYSEETFKVFYKTSEFIDFIKEFDGICFAHNGGKFDFHFLLDALEPNQEVLIINGRIAKIRIGKCELRDSWLLLPVPLAAYKKDDFDYKKLESDVRYKYMPEIEQYLCGDCRYLYEVINRQVEEYGLKITLPSSAFNFWFKRFSGLDKIPKTNKNFFDYFKPYYYGGRVECFKKGVFNYEFKSYDINSAYPYAMQHEHPFGCSFIRQSKLPKQENDIRKSFITFSGRSNGALPFRTKQGLSFPTGEDTRLFCCTGWELLEGLESNHIEIDRVERVEVFEQTICFKEYVDYFFKQKQQLKNVDAAMYLLAKLYLNSLYGKFAMDGREHLTYYTCSPEDIEEKIGSGAHFCGELGNLGLIGFDKEHHNFYNIATAASITGFVRAYLFKHIKKAEGVMYCDTDSITCKNLPCDIGKEIGQWENEGIYESGAIAGKKMYAYKYKDKEGYKIASKGVRFTEKEIFAVANGETISYNKEAPVFSIHKKPEFLTREIRMT